MPASLRARPSASFATTTAKTPLHLAGARRRIAHGMTAVPADQALGNARPDHPPKDDRCAARLYCERDMRKAMLNGLMMDDFQLSLTALVERAERLNSACPVVSRRPDGSVRRMTLGECAQRARRLASGLADLGIEHGDRVATLLWNQTEHLELYFAVPSMGAVIHTLNPRLTRRRAELHRCRRRGSRRSSWTSRCSMSSTRSNATLST